MGDSMYPSNINMMNDNNMMSNSIMNNNNDSIMNGNR